jgi:hypothetical protein
MEKMKTLADQLREEMVKPADKALTAKPESSRGKKSKPDARAPGSKPKKEVPVILEAITAYDTTANRSMVHARFDEKTVRLMNQFKMATDIDVTRLVAFSVKHLFETYPELKLTIKQFIQNNDL